MLSPTSPIKRKVSLAYELAYGCACFVGPSACLILDALCVMAITVAMFSLATKPIVTSSATASSWLICVGSLGGRFGTGLIIKPCVLAQNLWFLVLPNKTRYGCTLLAGGSAILYRRLGSDRHVCLIRRSMVIDRNFPSRAAQPLM